MLKTDSRKHALDHLLGKTWDELQVVEAHGVLHFPEVILKRGVKGQFQEVPILLRPLREHEYRQARVQARTWAAKEQLDPEKDRDLFDNLDSMCVLWRAIRSTDEPYEPLVLTPQELERSFDKPSLMQMWAKLDVYQEILDPRASDISKEEIGLVVAAIAKERDIRPLYVYDGPSQRTCIVSMAVLLLSLLASKSSSVQSAFSTADL